MRLNKFHLGLVFCLALSLPQGAGVLADARQDELKQLEQNIRSQEVKAGELEKKSKKLRAEMNQIRAELIALSQSVQQREASVTRIERALVEIVREEKLARNSLENRHGQSIETLMALQRMALNPPEAIIAMPQAPADMVRSAILLRTIVPEIQSQAESLRREVETYSKKRTLLENQKEKLGLANSDLEKERARLGQMMAQKDKLSERFLRDSQKARQEAQVMAEKAKDLRSLIENLEKAKAQRLEEARKEQKANLKALPSVPEKPDVPDRKAGDQEPDTEIVLGKPPSGKPIARAKGTLSQPASGSVIKTFGSKEELGGKHRGITIATRKSAQIVATYDGQVAFAGPFRSYRQLLIIDHGDGYHTLLTGMDRLDVSEGQWLLSGEPVGVMGAGSSASPELYFELRKKGAPINPLPWIRRQSTKAQG